VVGARSVVVQDSWIDGFDPGSEFRRATRLVNEQFHGAHLLQVRVDAGHTHFKAEVPWRDGSDFSFALPVGFETNREKLLNGWVLFTGNAHSNVGTFRTTVPAGTWRSWVQSVTNIGGTTWVSTPPTEGSPRFMLLPTNGEPVRMEFASYAHQGPELLHRLAAFEEFIKARRTNAVGGALGAA